MDKVEFLSIYSSIKQVMYKIRGATYCNSCGNKPKVLPLWGSCGVSEPLVLLRDMFFSVHLQHVLRDSVTRLSQISFVSLLGSFFPARTLTLALLGCSQANALLITDFQLLESKQRLQRSFVVFFSSSVHTGAKHRLRFKRFYGFSSDNIVAGNKNMSMAGIVNYPSCRSPACSPRHCRHGE